METLVLSICFSVAVSVFLKLAPRHAIRIDQAVAGNYLAALFLCTVLLHPSLDNVRTQGADAWLILALLGVLLPSIFLVMAAAVRHAGIVLSDAAQRLSLILPILAAFLLFGEQLSGTKLIGLLLAFAALTCLVSRKAATHAAAGCTPGRHPAWLLLGVWAGYGSIDILFKQMARFGAQFTTTLALSFALAAALMFAWLLWLRTRWHLRSLLSGLLLGTLNFSNIYFYIRAHQNFPDSPALVFAAMNIGVVSLGTLTGAGLFGERPSRLNLLGVALALTAIGFLLPR